MLAPPPPRHPFWLGPGFRTIVAMLPIAALVAGLIASAIERRDVINAQAICRRTGGEVLLGGDGTWRCAPQVER